MYPGIKAKILFITNFLKHSTNNPFVMQFLSTNNPSFLHSMPHISYVKFFLFEISYIPNERITIPIKYQYHLGQSFRKSTIWRNIASKHAPSRSRSLWYVLANEKLPLRETLYRQRWVNSPDCLECPGQNEDLTHKYTTCQHNRHI
jgi:hypothetical protein